MWGCPKPSKVGQAVVPEPARDRVKNTLNYGLGSRNPVLWREVKWGKPSCAGGRGKSGGLARVRGGLARLRGGLARVPGTRVEGVQSRVCDLGGVLLPDEGTLVAHLVTVVGRRENGDTLAIMLRAWVKRISE